jgi:hypothetical protein
LRNGDALSADSIGCGATFLPLARHQDVFLAVGDRQEAVRVEDPDVAGVEPALAVDHLGRGVGIVPVSLHHDGAPDQDLAVGRDLDLDARKGLPDRAELRALRRVAGDARRGLGHAVALKDRDADGVEEAHRVVGKGRAARHEEAELAPEPLAQLGIHELLEDRPLEGEDRADRAARRACGRRLPCPLRARS